MNNGPTVSHSGKLEIKALVEVVGPSELLKPCPTEFALLVDKNCKPESLLKICLHAVELAVEMDATEDTQVPPGTTTKEPELLLEDFTTTPNGAHPTLLLLVTITSKESTDLVHHPNPLLNAPNNVLMDTQDNTHQTNGLLNPFMEFLPMLPRFKLKS